MAIQTIRSQPVDTARQERNTELQVERNALLDELSAAEEIGSRVKIRRIKQSLEDNQRAFCEANMGLALSMAKRFMRGGSSNTDDYVQDAMVGLLEARERWDPERGAFSTFSRTWIAGRLRQGVRRTEYGLLSKADFDARPEVLLSAAHLEESLKREPTDTEVARATGIRESVVGRVRRAKTSSLDAPTTYSGGGEDTTRLGDVVAVAAGDPFEDDADARWDFVFATSPLLTAKQLFILARHLGLDGAPPQTLAEIGVITGFGREPARKEEDRAKAKLLAAGWDVPEAVV
jgi:RNA polymerase sigma factor (sigma-70 family)